jgi:hypothetical protein
LIFGIATKPWQKVDRSLAAPISGVIEESKKTKSCVTFAEAMQNLHERYANTGYPNQWKLVIKASTPGLQEQ